MTERPILFQGAMVRAILDGSKTQTRRIIKPVGRDASFVLQDYGSGWWPFRSDDGESAVTSDGNETPQACPYGQPGDRLWVREAWRTIAVLDGLAPRHMSPGDRLWYEADGLEQPGYGKYRPGMFMPRWASRITLEVVNVRVERLGDISEADALAEGLSSWSKDGRLVKYGIPDRDGLPGTDDIGWPWQEWCRRPQDAFFNLIHRIHGDESPTRADWVWVVEFKRVTP